MTPLGRYKFFHEEKIKKMEAEFKYRLDRSQKIICELRETNQQQRETIEVLKEICQKPFLGVPRTPGT